MRKIEKKYINNRESFSIEELNRAIDYLEKENSEKIDDIYLSFKAKVIEKKIILKKSMKI